MRLRHGRSILVCSLKMTQLVVVLKTTCHVVLEYCEGGEVKWKTDAGHPLLTVEQSRVIFRDIVLGLEYC